ncbi:MAG: DUF3472 domain-containing protein [Verrucomicrobiota bacterium]|jgi:hypothetical protein
MSVRSSLAVMLGFAVGLGAAGGQAEPPRAARSVHLHYPAPEGDVFYNEMVVEQSVSGSYFMACGWDTGYFGIQQLARGEEKVVLFSVWDPTGGDDPNAVKAADRVEVLAQGQGVRIRRFGGEGTGAQCLAPCPWKLGETNCFLVQSQVQSNKTAYTAHLWLASKKAWWKLATFRTATGGRPLRGYYSFIEDFRRDGASARETRRARCGNGWVRTVPGEWKALDKARFTASNASWESRDNIDAGLAGGWFYLATGGEITAKTRLQSLLQLPAPPAQPPALDFLAPAAPGPAQPGRSPAPTP